MSKGQRLHKVFCEEMQDKEMEERPMFGGEQLHIGSDLFQAVFLLCGVCTSGGCIRVSSLMEVF